MHYLHSDKKVMGTIFGCHWVLKGKRVSQLRVCRRTGHRTTVQYQLGKILQVMGQKHRPESPSQDAPATTRLGRYPLQGYLGAPTPGLARTYLALLKSRNPNLSPSFLQGSAHVASTVAKAIGGHRFPIARVRGCYGLYH